MTRPGLAVAVGSVGLLVAGRVLGVVELFIAGAAGLGLVAIALVAVLRPPPVLDLVRTVRPSRVHAGTASRVELRVANHGPRRSPVVTLCDGVTGTAGARLLLGRLAVGRLGGGHLPAAHRATRHRPHRSARDRDRRSVRPGAATHPGRHRPPS